MILYIGDNAFKVYYTTEPIIHIWVKREGSKYSIFADEIETEICIWKIEQEELDAYLASYKEVLSKFRRLMLLK